MNLEFKEILKRIESRAFPPDLTDTDVNYLSLKMSRLITSYIIDVAKMLIIVIKKHGKTISTGNYDKCLRIYGACETEMARRGIKRPTVKELWNKYNPKKYF